jgi:hypothetical protein
MVVGRRIVVAGSEGALRGDQRGEERGGYERRRKALTNPLRSAVGVRRGRARVGVRHRA